MANTNTDGLFTQLAHILDQIIDQYTALTPRAKSILRKKGFERRHINSLLKVKQAMIDANFLMTGNTYDENPGQMGLFK